MHAVAVACPLKVCSLFCCNHRGTAFYEPYGADREEFVYVDVIYPLFGMYMHYGVINKWVKVPYWSSKTKGGGIHMLSKTGGLQP